MLVPLVSKRGEGYGRAREEIDLFKESSLMINELSRESAREVTPVYIQHSVDIICARTNEISYA